MSKRRNKNKKAGPVRIIKPEAPVVSLAAEPSETVLVAEQRSEELVPPSDFLGTGEQSQAGAGEPSASEPEHLPAAASEAQPVDDAASEEAPSQETAPESTQAEEMAAPEIPAAEAALQETSFEESKPQETSLVEAVAGETSSENTVTASLSDEESQPEHGSGEQSGRLSEFEDASAALAEAIPVDPVEIADLAQLESIPIHGDSVSHSDGGDAAAPGLDDTPAQASDESVDPPVPAADAGVDAGSGRAGKKDRRLRLNKLQKHERSAPATEAEAVAPEPEAEPESLPAPQLPREPRIAAFAKLTEYQNLSLAHVPGLPEESDVPGHWRGVGFGIGGRRLVSAFDEVVEIMRLPQITHVPGTQPWMLGVANVRGTLLPVVDLKQFLEGVRTVMHEGQRVLVVRQAGGNVAVLIDQLFGQRSFNDSQKATSAGESGTRYDNFIKQIYRVGDNDWGVFSMSMLTRTPEFRQAAA